jgi:hypothetical protein
MGRKAFIKPETVRLQLAEGDWIDVKKHLTVREMSDLSGAGLVGFKPATDAAPAYELSFSRLKTALIKAYVVGWSFEAEDGKPQPVTPENIDALDPAVADEVIDAIEAHRKRIDEERKRPTGVPAGETS